MQKFIGSFLAIGVAGVAAIAATTAMLNAPHRIGPVAETTPPNPAAQNPSTPAETRPAVPETGKPATSEGTPDAGKAATSAGAAAPGSEGAKEEEADKDPYEGIAPEELPPDLQYNADSSVSFPTNI